MTLLHKMYCVIAILFVPLSSQANEAAVVRIDDGCSGVCVSGDGLILTADHCGTDQNVSVVFPDGSRFSAALIYLPPQNGVDEAQCYRIPNASRLPFAAVASESITAGQPVWSVGYPAGNYQLNRGTVSRIGFTTRRNDTFSVRLDDGVVTDWGSDAGNSGGPLFNSRGEVCGLLSMTGDTDSYWIGLSSIRTAIDRPDILTVYKRRSVIVFTTDTCSACDRLKFDAAAGKLGEYEFKFVNWDNNLKTWSDPVLAREFSTTAGAPGGLGFPVVWVRNTKNYRVGYEPDRRGGLIGWIAGIFDGLGRLIVGEKPTIEFPPAEPLEPSPDDPPPAPTQTDVAMEAVQKVKDDLLRIKSDVESVKSANPVTKLKAVFALKADAAAAKANAAIALAEIKGVKDDAKEKPLQYLWGLFGILTGLAHRRLDS